jgi:putative membrane protein
MLYLKGLSMGGADVIPGVSGGTIAFITGIYSELVHSIKAIDAQALRLLLSLQFKAFWEKINGGFLLAVFAGIVTSLLSLAKLMVSLLKSYPVQTWSFFFGLILISSPLILRSIMRWNIAVVGSIVVGIVVAYLITVSSPTQSPEALWFVFLSGALAICAMILPGISGAFILLLIGKYEFIMQALLAVNLPVIITFALGCLIGIIAFSWVLTWILDHYHDLTIALLAGFMLGSLNKVWPWKQCLSYHLDSNGQQECAFDKSILPGTYMANSGNDPQVFQAILFGALGVIIVLLIEKVAERMKTKI